MLPRTGQETMEIAFVIVTPSGNSLEVYIDPFIESPPHYCVGPSFSGLNQSTHQHDSDNNFVSSQDGEMDYDGFKDSPSYVDLNKAPAILDKTGTIRQSREGTSSAYRGGTG